MPELILEHWTSFKTIGVGICQFPSSPTNATIDPEDGTAAGSSKSTGDQAFLDSESSRVNVDDANIDIASRDCVSCSDMDEMSV